ncbi:MAG: antitoxin [Candidatus Accumulibacter sp.]|nr:antitoxin [Candidatus Accumulibacter necessarius]
MSGLTIDVTDQQHQSLKVMAALQGKSIREYALERLFPPASDEEQAFRDLKALLEQRIAESQKGDVVPRSLTQIAEDALTSGGRT